MKNIGTTDRIARLTCAAMIVIAFALNLIGGWLAVVLGGVALALVVTSLFSTCPAYLPFGLSTRRGR